MRHLVTLCDVTSAEVARIFAITEDLKTKFAQGLREPLLPGRTLALLFEKQSLRTRVSFEAGITHLGGSSIMLGEDVGFGKRESIADFTRVLSEMVDVIVVRAKQHATVEEVAEHANCSVINGLTDESHPCQALADLYTMREHFGKLAGLKLAWVGDGNNVARSLVRRLRSHGREARRRHAHGLRARRASSSPKRGSNFRILNLVTTQRSGRSRARRVGRLHRRLGQHGPGRPSAPSGSPISPPTR